MTSPPESPDLFPEERRLLRRFECGTERDGTIGGGPPHLVHEHPDVFRVHPRRSDDADPLAVRRLPMLTGATIVLVLLLAQFAVTGHAWLLALLAALAGLLFYAGFLEPGVGIFRHLSQAAFVVAIALFGVTAYFGWREANTIEELARIIEPVPEIVDVTYVPTGGELAAFAGFGAAVDALPGDGRFSDEQYDTAGWAARVAELRSMPRYWLVETKLSPADVMAFYAQPENIAGWTHAGEQGEGMLLLARGPERLMIIAHEDWPQPGTVVGYVYRRAK
ncbi:MAG TPA: hypothetical protein VF192_13750 [Longimicrobiales bacterium]